MPVLSLQFAWAPARVVIVCSYFFCSNKYPPPFHNSGRNFAPLRTLPGCFVQHHVTFLIQNNQSTRLEVFENGAALQMDDLPLTYAIAQLPQNGVVVATI